LTVDFNHAESAFADWRKIGVLAEIWDIDTLSTAGNENGLVLGHHVGLPIHLNGDEVRLAHPLYLPSKSYSSGSGR
jgi:hypothetical protein